MSVVYENVSNNFIRLAALAELKCNKLLVDILVSQQSRLMNVLYKQLRVRQDLCTIYDCTQEIAKILDTKKQFIEEIRKELMIDFKVKTFAQNVNISNENSMKINLETNEIKIKLETNENSDALKYRLENGGMKGDCMMKNKNVTSSFIDDQNRIVIKIEDIEEEYEYNKNSVQGMERVYKCSYDCCSKIYKTKNGRYHHIHRYHLNIKHHNCEYCNIGFYYKSDWRKHVRIHTGERPYSCLKCEKKFALKHHLKYHGRVHTEERSSVGVLNKI